MQSNLEINPATTRSVNISVIKPSGITSFWNWFSSKNKKPNLQNLVFDKKIKLKLNPEELQALKRNGIDFQKLQNAALSNEKKIGKSFFIFSKDQTELNKNELINNRVLCELLKNKHVSNKTRKYKRSLVSSSSLSIKSKNNNPKITYIHSIKSKKSIVNSVSSNLSMRVGMNNDNTRIINPMNKNILPKGIPEALLKGKMQKKIFVPIYLGKKKSSKTNRGENPQNETNKKEASKNDSNMIPLLLTKIKTMEEQISDIENTTKQINQAVSQRNTFQTNNPPKASMTNATQSNKKIPGRMYPKRSLRKFKQNNLERPSKSKTSTSPACSDGSNNANNATEVKFNNTMGENSARPILTCANNYQIRTLRDILENPENILKYHTFTIPEKLSEKTLFKANPDVGCDVILKLFETLSENNNSYNEKFTDGLQTSKISPNPDEVEPNTDQNLNDIKSETDCNEKLKSLSSISESQITVSDKHDGEKLAFSKQKKNISCPSSSTVVNCVHPVEPNCTLKNNSNFEIEKEINQIGKNKHNEVIQYKNKINKEQIKNKVGNLGNNISSVGKILVCSRRESETSTLNKESLILRDSFNVVEKEISDNKDDLRSLKQPISIVGMVQIDPGKKTSVTSIQSNNNHINFKFEEKKDLKDVALQESEGQLEKQMIQLPFATDSRNICSISIEQTEDPEAVKQTEIEVKGMKILCQGDKKEPNFSIKIMVKNNQTDEVLFKSDSLMKCNRPEINHFLSVKDEQPSSLKKEAALFLSGGDGDSVWKSADKSVNSNSEKYIPPLKFETSDTTAAFFTTCSISNNNEKKEKGLQDLNLNHKRKEFGISGVVYLNEEERKKFDKQISNTVNQKSQETPKSDVKIGKICSINLKNEISSIRHLSEGYINPSNNTVKVLSKQRTLPFTMTSLPCSKNNSSSLLQSFKFKKNISNTSEAVYTNKNILCSRCSHYKDNQVIINEKNKEETKFTKFSEKTILSSLTSIDHIFEIDNKSQEKLATRVVVSKQNLSTNNNYKLSGDRKNNEIPDLSSWKKRINRCNLTLNQDSILKGLKGEQSYKICTGTNQSERQEVNIQTEINNSIKEKDNNKCLVLNSLADETIKTTNYNSAKEKLSNQQKITATMSNPQKCPFVVLPMPEIPKYIPTHNLMKDNDRNKSSSNEHNLTSQTNVTTPKSETPVSPESGCDLISLPVSEMPKCCPCILAKANQASGAIVRSQAEILLEKAGSLSDQNGKISIICNTCVNKSKDNNIELVDTKNKDKVHETFNNPDFQVNYSVDKKISTKSEAVNSQDKFVTILPLKETSEGESLEVSDKNESFVVLENAPGEEMGIKHQIETNHFGEQTGSCYHTCLTTPSEEYVNSDVSEENSQEAFCLNTVSDQDCSYKYNIGNGIINFYSNNNEPYLLENLCNVTTIFDFNGEEIIPIYYNLNAKMQSNWQDAKDNHKIIEKIDDKNPSSININSREGNPFSITRRETGEDSSASTHNHFYCSGSAHNKRHMYLDGKKKHKRHNNSFNKSLNQKVLKPIKENDVNKESETSFPHDNECSTQITSHSTYVVNYMHSIEYDSTVYACALNSTYSSELTENKEPLMKGCQ